LVEAARIPEDGATIIDDDLVLCSKGDYLVRDALGKVTLLSRSQFENQYESLDRRLYGEEK
jgi:hypothetical protein